VNSHSIIRRRLRLPSRGIELALVDWGGDGPLALLAHANGFCADVLGPLAERLRARFHVVGFDARGHGDSE
jgi:pimeloyl-ACP methyl ester carboxylesterase